MPQAVDTLQVPDPVGVTDAGNKRYIDAALAQAVTLTPGTAARNTIQSTANITGLTVKGAAGQTAASVAVVDSSGASQVSLGPGPAVTIGGDAFIQRMAAGRIQTSGDFRVSAAYGDASNYTQLSDATQQLKLNKVAASGASTIDISPIPSDGVSTASARYFRNTNTTGQAALDVLTADGNGSGRHRLGANVVSYLASDGSGIAVGTTAAVANQLLVQATDTATAPLKVKAKASQTADLQTWSDSSNASLARISSNGGLIGTSLGPGGTGLAVLRPNGDTGGFLLTTGADSNKGLVIKGNTAAGQAGNLLEFQDGSGNLLARVTPNGLMYAGSRFGVGTLPAAGFIAKIQNTLAVDQVPLILQALAAQTASIQEWRNSAGTALAKVGANGAIAAPQFDASGTAGGGLVLKSPDGTQTKTVSINNSGTLVTA